MVCSGAVEGAEVTSRRNETQPWPWWKWGEGTNAGNPQLEATLTVQMVPDTVITGGKLLCSLPHSLHIGCHLST